MKNGLVILLILILVVIAPLVIIWALNTLFPALAIAYSVETWLATFILSSVLGKPQITKVK